MGRVEGTAFPNVILLTGPREIGKTRLLLKLVERFHSGQIDFQGVLSPAVFDSGVKTAIDLLNIKDGERRRLASLRTGESSGTMTDRWVFEPDTLDWGNTILGAVTACDILLVDELGPLELERDLGLQNGVRAISNGEYKMAIVVIRPELLSAAALLWPGSVSTTLTDDPGSIFLKLTGMIDAIIKMQ